MVTILVDVSLYAEIEVDDDDLLRELATIDSALAAIALEAEPLLADLYERHIERTVRYAEPLRPERVCHWCVSGTHYLCRNRMTKEPGRGGPYVPCLCKDALHEAMGTVSI